MSVRGVIGGAIRGVIIATATAAAAFGALVVFDPFGGAATTTPTVTTAPASTAVQQRIETLRLALRETEAELTAARSAPVATIDLGSRAQYEAQIAAAIERRDLALRHAAAIRESLKAGGTPSSLAAIRDSVVIGQLLGQQSALDAQIAIDGARLRPNHPTMRALTAQRASLATQIQQEAANIASALEAEARIDDAQIELLQAQLPTPGGATALADTTALEARAASQRAELDGLVDAYFNIPAAVTAQAAASARNPFSTGNLAVVIIAGAAALVFQLLMARRRSRLRAAALAEDLAIWNADSDPETVEITEADLQRKAA